MKRRPLFLLILPLVALGLSSCSDAVNPSNVSTPPSSSQSGSSSAPDSSSPAPTRTPLEKAILAAQAGFEAKTTQVQSVYDKKTDAFVFKNEYGYDYRFENADGATKTDQSYTDGTGETYSRRLVRDSSGYAATEYVDYRNEIASARLTDSEGYFVDYDYHYGNPFLLLEAADLEKTGEDTYALVPTKADYFAYLLFGQTTPIEEMTFTLEGDVFTAVTSKSVDIDSYTRDLPDGTMSDEYYRVYYNYTTTTALTDMGTCVIDSPKLSEEDDEGKALTDFFRTIGDNYTLTSNVFMKDGTKDDSLASVTYFDKDRCYLDYEVGDTSLYQDTYYAYDEFRDDGLLYEYAYDGAGWVLNPASSQTAYNVDPQPASFFVPHAADIATSLIKNDGEGAYSIGNDAALPYIGNAFLPDFSAVVLFDYGYITDVRIALDAESVTIDIDFLYSYYGSYYEMVYEYTYSDIGTTVLPIDIA